MTGAALQPLRRGDGATRSVRTAAGPLDPRDLIGAARAAANSGTSRRA
jgi:hypothetical protein